MKLHGSWSYRFLTVLVLAGCTAAGAAQEGDWRLVRSMRDTFDGPDVGAAYGQLLLMGIDFADANRGVIGGFNDPTEIRHQGRAEGMLGYTTDGGRTFRTRKTRSHVWTVGHAAGEVFWAAGVGLVMRSNDGGRTWKRIRGGGGGYPTMQFHFTDADHGLLALGGMFRTADGKTLNRVKTGAKSTRAVSLGEGGFGVAAGDHGELLFTKDGGATWSFSPDWRKAGKNRRPNFLRRASAVGRTHAWVVGDNGLVLRTTDAGKTVEEQHIGDGDWLTGVGFGDTKRGWVIGTHYVYRSEDGGVTWRKQPTAGGLRMNSLCVRDADTAWIAGHYGVIQKTTDGGKTWQTLNDYTDLYAVTMVDDEVGYAGAESGGVLKTTDGGKTWRPLPAIRGSAVEAILFRDAKTGWVVGDFGHVAYTTDGGATWKPGKIDFKDILKDLHMFDARRGVAVGARGAVFSTADGGATWRRVPTPTDKMLCAVDFPTGEIGYACGSGVVLKTADGGATWKRLDSPTIDIISDVRFLSRSRGLMVGDIGQIFLTFDGGGTWRRVGSPSRQWLHRIEVVDQDTFLVPGSRGTIIRTSDGGKSWEAMKSGTVRNIYCISRNVAVGRWGEVQLLNPGVDVKRRIARPHRLGPKDLLPPALWNRPPADAVRASSKIDEKGRLLAVTVNGRTFPISGDFPNMTVAVLTGDKVTAVKQLAPDDKSWKVTPVKGAKGEKAFLFDNGLLTARVSYKHLPDRLTATVSVLKEKRGRVLNVSAGEQYVRLIGDSPEVRRRGALAVPVDGGELIPFVGFNVYRSELQKWNYLHGWYFKNRMISFTDGKAGLILRSHQWQTIFLYGQRQKRGRPMPTQYLFMGMGFDTRLRSADHLRSALKKDASGVPAPEWVTGPLPIATIGFDLQYVGDVNGDGDVNWVDAGITYRDTNFPRSTIIDRTPGMCDTFGQTRVAWNWGYILWSSPYIGNTHSEVRAHKRRSDGRLSLEWGCFSRSIAYETASGRMARYFDKQADECDFPPVPAHIGSDTWTCGLGRADHSVVHPGTAEQSARAKVEVLHMLGRRGYVTNSEALSEWGLAGRMVWGWWTPYYGGGAWLAGFSRCWEYSPRAHSGPVRSHLFAQPIPLQTVIHQGMLYWGSGVHAAPACAILNGCRPNSSGVSTRDDAFFYYPWLVLWKTVSPRRVTNIRELKRDLWELTYDDAGVLELDVRANTWVFKKDGITYDGYSPPNPAREPIRPRPGTTWGVPWDLYGKKYVKGSFGVWRSGTFSIKVPGIKAVKPPRVAGTGKKGQAPPAYTTSYRDGVLTITIKDKDPVAHPMLIFDPKEPVK